MYVYKINECDRESRAYLCLSAKQTENSLGDLVPFTNQISFFSFPSFLCFLPSFLPIVDLRLELIVGVLTDARNNRMLGTRGFR
jgi:hypothetical protein